MFDGDDGGHPGAHIRPGEILIFFLQNIQLPGVTVDDRRELRLKAGQMSSPFSVVNVIAKAQNVLVEIVRVLDSPFYGNPFALPGKGNHIRHRFAGLIHVPDKARQPFRLMVLKHLDGFFSPILKADGEGGV